MSTKKPSKKTPAKKLSLSRETVRDLASPKSGAVKGGAMANNTWTYCTNCNCRTL